MEIELNSRKPLTVLTLNPDTLVCVVCSAYPSTPNTVKSLFRSACPLPFIGVNFISSSLVTLITNLVPEAMF